MLLNAVFLSGWVPHYPPSSLTDSVVLRLCSEARAWGFLRMSHDMGRAMYNMRSKHRCGKSTRLLSAGPQPPVIPMNTYVKFHSEDRMMASSSLCKGREFRLFHQSEEPMASVLERRAFWSL